MFDKWTEILNLLNLYTEGVFNLDIDFITSIIMELQLV